MTQVNDIHNSKLSNILTPIKSPNNKKIECKYKNDFFNNINSTTLKITKTKEININEIKNNKLNILDRRKFSKTITSKNISKERPKLFSNSRDKIYINSVNKDKDLKNDIDIKESSPVQSSKNKSKQNEKQENIIKNYPYGIRVDSFNKINNKNKNNENNISRKNNSLKLFHQVNLSLDKLDWNRNKIITKNKLSPNKIKKLKMINLPIPKSQIIKFDNDKNKSKGFLDKSINNLPSFYQYVKNQKNLDNKFIRMTKQSICFYRVYNKKNKKCFSNQIFPLKLEKIGFSKGYISITLKSDILQFIPKVNNNNELSIFLKNIIGIQIEQYMQNVIKEITTHDNKINNGNDSSKIKDNQKKEYFAFNVLVCDFYEGKIECIFDNFDLFNFWMKFLEQIAEYYRNNDNIN